MTTRVLYLEGACYDTVELSSFSRQGVLEFLDILDPYVVSREADDARDLTINHYDNDMIVVSVFNYDGEMKSFIGCADEFIGRVDV